MGPDDDRKYQITGPRSDSQLSNKASFDLRKGNRYEVRLTRVGGHNDWYCWEAQIDNKPGIHTFDDEPSPIGPWVEDGIRNGNAKHFTVGDNWVVDNRTGLISSHLHSVGKNIATGLVATLIPMEVTCPELYMFKGHKNDVVELCKVSGIACEWKLKNATPDVGTFNNPNDIACNFITTETGKNTIQLVIENEVIWEKPIEVLQIIERTSWGAYEANVEKLSTTPTLNGITFHHSSNTADGATEVLRIQDMHMQKSVIYWPRPGSGWGDIGYHFLMDKSGNVYEGRQLEAAPGKVDGPYTLGSHVKNNNTAAGIGVCVLGDYEGTEVFTPARQKSLEKVLSAIARRYKLTSDKISYHQARATANETKCPGSNIIPKAADIIENVNINLQ